MHVITGFEGEPYAVENSTRACELMRHLIGAGRSEMELLAQLVTGSTAGSTESSTHHLFVP